MIEARRPWRHSNFQKEKKSQRKENSCVELIHMSILSLQLNFSRGDIITVTQVVEGGWWEGTLGETTGWFPSNYVKDVKPGSIKPK